MDICLKVMDNHGAIHSAKEGGTSGSAWISLGRISRINFVGRLGVCEDGNVSDQIGRCGERVLKKKTGKGGAFWCDVET